MKNYNTFTKKYRFFTKQISYENPNQNKTLEYLDDFQLDQLIRYTDKEYEGFSKLYTPYNYNPYLFYLSLWFFKNLIYMLPISKLDKQSKRHITIVTLMILTILIMVLIAYFQGVFDTTTYN
ncbi:MAG: hypothetical protein CVU00_11870 [Bacteroidetes bacterium HGW-Bacteroidetes-17]|jgi:hypothetical protein|nr:MAG: hypothetical protein CVU00_11870 [Bacteroidetes bacterium HGW-Bacteroidetes-17]